MTDQEYAIHHELMKSYFDRICDKNNWKNPINSLVVIGNKEEKKMFEEAIIYFTGSLPKFSRCSWTFGSNMYRVTADGYYKTIGA